MSDETNTSEAVETTESEAADDPVAKELAKVKAAAEKSANELSEIKSRDAKRRAEERKAADDASRQAAVDNGNAAAELAKAQAILAEREAEIGKLRGLESKRVDKALESLPEEHRAGLEDLRTKMTPDQFAEVLEYTTEKIFSSAAAMGDGGQAEARPANTLPAGTTPGGRVKRKEGRNLPEGLEQLLNSHGVDATMSTQLQNDGGKVGKSLERFMKDLNSKAEKGTLLTRESADAINRLA